MIARLLVDSGDYHVVVGDVSPTALERVAARVGVDTIPVDVESPGALEKAMSGRDSVISALSFNLNPRVAEAALSTGINYFDLTEDIFITEKVRAIAQGAVDGQ